MNRTSILIALALSAAAPAAAPLPVDIGGRVVRDSDGALRFGWPGVYFEGRFHGTGVTVAEPGNDVSGCSSTAPRARS